MEWGGLDKMNILDGLFKLTDQIDDFYKTKFGKIIITTSVLGWLIAGTIKLEMLIVEFTSHIKIDWIN